MRRRHAGVSGSSITPKPLVGVKEPIRAGQDPDIAWRWARGYHPKEDQRAGRGPPKLQSPASSVRALIGQDLVAGRFRPNPGCRAG